MDFAGSALHPAIYVIGFVIFAVLIVWLARGSREDPPDGSDERTKVRWFHDGGGVGPGPGSP
jgi:hypothetical protein